MIQGQAQLLIYSDYSITKVDVNNTFMIISDYVLDDNLFFTSNKPQTYDNPSHCYSQKNNCDWLWENPPLMHEDKYLEIHNSLIQSVIS